MEPWYDAAIPRLANALSALYAMGSEEKALIDAMLLALPRQYRRSCNAETPEG